MTAAPGNVLLVCNANECRSAIAQLRLQSALAAHGLAGAFAVSSAGLRATPGNPVIPECVPLLGADGIRTGSFRSRPVTADLLADARAVITMSAAERSAVLRLRARSLPCTATLSELAACALRTPPAPDLSPPERLDALVARTIADRGWRTPPDPRSISIADPVGCPPGVLRVVDATIARAVAAVVGHLVPAPRPDVVSWSSP